jgi:hypothetical protein
VTSTPLIFELVADGETDPKASITTYYCVPSGNMSSVPPQREDCGLISNSPYPINTGNFPVDCAHNFAYATFRYFWEHHQRNSLDNHGFPLVSYVLSEDYKLANGTYLCTGNLCTGNYSKYETKSHLL